MAKQRLGKRGYIEAGIRLLNRAAMKPVIRVPDVVKEAGVTTSAFYQVWNEGGNQQYFDALFKDILNPDRFLSMQTIPALIGALAQQERPLDDLKELLREDFDLVCDDQTNGALLYLIATSRGDRDLAISLRKLYRSYDYKLEQAMEPVLLAWGRKPIPPLDLRDLAVVFNSAIDGFSTRHGFDIERANRQLWVRLALTLLMSLTCPIDDDESDIDRRAESINDWPQGNE